MHTAANLKRGLGDSRPSAGWFSFGTNGASDPSLALPNLFGPLRGYIQSITYSATGIQTIVFTPDFKVAGRVQFTADYEPDALANNLGIAVIGAYNNTTRTLIVQTLSATSLTTGAAPNTASFIKVRCEHVEID